MSNSSPSTQPLHQILEPEAVHKVSPSQSQEPPNHTDPPPKSDPEIAPLAGQNLDPGYNSPDEEEEEEEGGEEIEQGQQREKPAISSGISLHIDPPITDPHESASDVTLTSPSRRGATKRKKGKGRGKGKKLQVIQEKFQTLIKNLNPIPFIPTRILDFANHEKLLTKLGLWEFVHIDFDRSIRVDLIAQLVASYNPKLRASYVNDCRIMVNRTDLARAFKLPLPLKKEKGNVGMEVDLEWEDLSDDSIGFLDDVLSGWLLFHEELWEMPTEVMDWMKLIKDGHPEKVDWAGLLWLMVEKELKQGARLRDCYYASHLQHLIKHQRADLLLQVEPNPAEQEVDGEANEEKEVNEENSAVGVGIDSPRKEDPTLGGPSTELTLGQDGEKEEGMTLGHDGEKEEGMKDVEMNETANPNGSDGEDGGEEQGQWFLNGKNEEEEHFMQPLNGKKQEEEHFLQPCGAENGEEFDSFEDRKDEEEEMDGEEDEEQEGVDFHDFPNDDDALEGDGFTGNLLQMGANHVSFGSQDQLRIQSSMDARVDMHPSFFANPGKRVIEHDNHITHGDNKRLRINDSWDNKPVDFGMCMEQIQQVMERARMLYAEKEQTIVESGMNQQVLLNEMQKRDAVIEHLHKSRLEEMQKKDREIYRLERELYLMGNVLDGYRKALKDVKKAFGEYKERAKLPEEPTYKDTGDGGLMLTSRELEKYRKKKEEDYKMNCLIIEHKVKEVGEDLARLFDGCIDKINCLDRRLIGLEGEAKELIEMHKIRKMPPTEEQEAEGKVSETQPSAKLEEKMVEENVMESSEAPSSPKPEEKVADEDMMEVTEAQLSPKPEEKVADEDMMEVTETQASLKPEEKVTQVLESSKTPDAETAEDVPVTQTEEIPDAEAAEDVPVPQTEEIPDAEAAEDVPVPQTEEIGPKVEGAHNE